MDGINVLLSYFLTFRNIEIKNENNVNIIKKIDKVIKVLENAKNHTKGVEYLTDYNFMEELTKKYDFNAVNKELKNIISTEYNLFNEEDIKSSDKVPNHLKEMLISSKKGIDNILLDLMLNLNRYNTYLMNKKNKSVDVDIVLEKDITFDEIDVNLKDILSYLEVDENEFDKKILSALNKYAKLDELKKRAIELKTGTGLKRVLFDKINDKNILLSILLHSSFDVINDMEDMFKNRNININKLIECIPSIFIPSLKDNASKYKFDVLRHYEAFMSNVELLDKSGVDVKSMLNQPIFFINSPEKNMDLIKRLQSLNVSVKNVLEYIGNIFVLKPEVVFNNINTLSLYGIKLTDDENNNGYTLLGMEDMHSRLDYLIEQGLWKKTDGVSLDNIDLIRGLIIKDDYLKWKNNYKYVTLDSTSQEKDEFTNLPYSDEKLRQVYEKYPEISSAIQILDKTYLVDNEGYYSINDRIVSRLRVLRNLCNYNGKGNLEEIFDKVLKHKSNINNSEEVISAIKQTLEMGDEGVKLSQRL